MAAASALDEETAAKVLRQVGGCRDCNSILLSGKWYLFLCWDFVFWE